MDLLILGGTRFLGRHLVEAALACGHRVTLFNRGVSGAGMFPNAEELRGDRSGDLSALRGRRWDAAIDVSGYLPRDVQASAGLLADAVGHYTFVSSISVYEDFGASGFDEGAPVLAPPDPEPEEVEMELYGNLKVGCERAAEAALPGRSLVIRPGMIVGPHDYTDRFPQPVEKPFVEPHPAGVPGVGAVLRVASAPRPAPSSSVPEARTRAAA